MMMKKIILIAISFFVGVTMCDAQEYIGAKKAYTTSEQVDNARKIIHRDWFGPLIDQDPILIGPLQRNTAYFEIDYKLHGYINKGFLSITNKNLNTKNRTIDQIIKSDIDWYFQDTNLEDRVTGFIRSTVIQAGYYFDDTSPIICVYFLNNNTKEIVAANIEILGTKDEKIAFTKDFIKKYANIKWKIKI
ncbi:hypothetical protein SF1_21940 [Sphingobacterium faecium NBRC 15299]|uniref:hypothetical protein n=1 Tax=Sphingobacterium faecium TaxID=34087 RepID=UPI000D334128|nr:hypothetical protein [Sphingobacterium faecium]GEM64212.1 hypothetical protein SF1_21940 [Sphingobacterium faecium NBRC 15299]